MSLMKSPKHILVTGSSGFIGTHLTTALAKKGYKVITSTRENLLPLHLEGTIHGIIHLGGKHIFGRWTPDFKKAIYNSRIDSTRQMIQSVSTWKNKPVVFMCASAFGIYGDKKEQLVDESSKPGTDFLATLCVDWESEAKKAEGIGIRSVQIRITHVLGKKGLLAPLYLPFKLGFGAWIGKGSGWFPWVHIDDLIHAILFVLETPTISGPVNICSPQSVRQKEFMILFGKSLHRWVVFQIPIFLLRLRYGSLADTFKNSAKLSSQKLLDAGFRFKFNTLKDAFLDITSKKIPT